MCRNSSCFIEMKYRLTKYYLKKIINNNLEEYEPSELLFESKNTTEDQWIFHDENWVHIIDRFEHRRVLAQGLQLNVIENPQAPTDEVIYKRNGSIRFEGKTKTNDEWIYLYLEPEKYQWENYEWKFRIRRDTLFREFQFGVRYLDFYNRYRYRFENNHIYFDKVLNGRFYNAYGVVSFHMELGVWYDIKIVAYKNNFRCYINDKLMLNDYDFDNDFPKGSIALILWEDNGRTDIKADVGPIFVYEIK